MPSKDSAILVSKPTLIPPLYSRMGSMATKKRVSKKKRVPKKRAAKPKVAVNHRRTQVPSPFPEVVLPDMRTIGVGDDYREEARAVFLIVAKTMYEKRVGTQMLALQKAGIPIAVFKMCQKDFPIEYADSFTLYHEAVLFRDLKKHEATEESAWEHGRQHISEGKTSEYSRYVLSSIARQKESLEKISQYVVRQSVPNRMTLDADRERAEEERKATQERMRREATERSLEGFNQRYENFAKRMRQIQGEIEKEVGQWFWVEKQGEDLVVASLEQMAVAWMRATTDYYLKGVEPDDKRVFYSAAVMRVLEDFKRDKELCKPKLEAWQETSGWTLDEDGLPQKPVA